MELEITYTKYNTHVKDSYKVKDKDEIERQVYWIIQHREAMHYPTRTSKSYEREWIGHNRLYNWHIERERTGSVDLNENQNPFEKLFWYIIGR